MLDLAQYQITGTTARQIAASTEAAIRDGVIATGVLLPTVRALAQALGTSPATVSAAYRTLAQRGFVVADGRRGTRVAPRPALHAPERSPAPPAPTADTRGRRDLAGGFPDQALLPALEPALRRLELTPRERLYGLEGGDPRLLELAAAAFAADGVPADAIAVVSGAFDGIERVLQTHLRPGDRVIIEDPAYSATRDLLLPLGLVAVPVPVDDVGPIPERLEAALQDGAEAIVVTPRAQNPFGSALDETRRSALCAMLEHDPEVLIIEDDHAGPVAGAAYRTLVTSSTGRWAVVRSVSKFLGPDLRLALVAGDPLTIARVEGRQALGPRWVSHILQGLAAELLSDPEIVTLAAHAGDVYAARRGTLIDALAAHGITAHGRSGLNVWVELREEAPVVQALRDGGWIVAAGERFRLRTAPGVRISASLLRDGEAEAIAAVIAGVELAARPRALY